MYRLVTELRKIGRVADARYTEQDMIKMAKRLLEAPNDTLYEQDVAFLAKLTNRNESLAPNIVSSGAGGGSQMNPHSKSKLPPTAVRRKLSWVD